MSFSLSPAEENITQVLKRHKNTILLSVLVVNWSWMKKTPRIVTIVIRDETTLIPALTIHALATCDLTNHEKKKHLLPNFSVVIGMEFSIWIL